MLGTEGSVCVYLAWVGYSKNGNNTLKSSSGDTEQTGESTSQDRMLLPVHHVGLGH